MSAIHPTAIIESGAQLDSTVSVGPYSVIGPHVKVGAGTTIGPHCVIEGHTTIGQDNRIFQFSSLGAIPQDKKYASDNWLMAYVHLAHDCVVGNHTIFANNSQLAGHVHVDDWAILGGFTVAHQFVRIGAHSMTAMCTLLFADLPPFVMCQGQPASARSMNYEGLRRRGFSAERVQAVKSMHKALYRDELTLVAAQDRIASLVDTTPEAAPDITLMLSFLEQVAPQRGIVR